MSQNNVLARATRSRSAMSRRWNRHSEDRSTLTMLGQEYVTNITRPPSAPNGDTGGLPPDVFQALVSMWEEILVADYRAHVMGPLDSPDAD